MPRQVPGPLRWVARLFFILAFVIGPPCEVEAARPNDVAAPTTISIADVKYTVDPGQKIGEKRAGLLCLPNGSLAFRQIALPSDAVLVDEILGELAKMGLVAVGQDSERLADPETTYRIVPTVVGIDLSVCAKHWGLGDRSGLKGKAAVSLEWALYERETRRRVGLLTLKGSSDSGNASMAAGELVRRAILNAVVQIGLTPEGRAFHNLN